MCLDVGLQWALDDRPKVPKRVLVVSGPTGVGKSSVIQMLLRDFSAKLAYVAPFTTARPNKREV